MSIPLRRVEPDQPVSATSFNGLVDAVNQLRSIRGAFPIEVRRHPGGVQVSLAVQEKEAVVQLTSALSSGGSASAKILHFNGTDWVAAETDPIRVYDAIGSMEGRVNSHALCRFHRQSGRWIVWQLEC